MAQGDVQDFTQRLYQVLPTGWFPDLADAPILDAILIGFATPLAWAYDRVKYAQLQTRIATSTEEWVDLISYDYLGSSLPRREFETDAQFAARISLEIVRPRGTRAALSQVLFDLTGQVPTIFEPRNSGDTGGYNLPATLAYNTVGGYGDLNLPFQLFIRTVMPPSSPLNVGGIGGWGNIAQHVSSPSGYGIGSIEYCSSQMITGPLGIADIYAAIVATMPAGTIAWVSVTAAGLPVRLTGGLFILDASTFDDPKVALS